MVNKVNGAHGRLSPESQKGTTERSRKDQKAIGDIKAVLIKLGVIIVAGWVLLGFVFGVAVKEGEDMYPRIRDGDLMVFYRLQQEYHVGDVVTFLNEGQRYTARIVAQGGDAVDITEEGQLIVNGSAQDEEIFYPTESQEGGTVFPCEVPEGSVFLLSDFRTIGVDSRMYGPVEMGQLDGKVITLLRRRGI